MSAITEGQTVSIADLAAIGGLSVYAWTVPGLFLGLPGVLILLVVLAQILGAGAFLPVTRRLVGGFGVRRRRRRRGGG